MQYPARSGTACSTAGTGAPGSSAGEAEHLGHHQRRRATQPASRRPQKRRRGPRAGSNGVPKERGQRRNRQGGHRRNRQGGKWLLGQQHRPSQSLRGVQGRDLPCCWECSSVSLLKLHCRWVCSFDSFPRLTCGWVSSFSSFRRHVPCCWDCSSISSSFHYEGRH